MTSVPHSGAKSVTPGGSVAGGGHTAGEWSLDVVPSGGAFGSAAGRAYGVSAKSASGYRTPIVVWRGIARPASAEGQANAHLIAAAPELLEALDPEAVDIAADLFQEAGKHSVAKVMRGLADRQRAAIAKATAGETRNAEGAL